MNLRRKIPSAQSLFVFEAAARHLNFTAAGLELNVSQPAVSKTIRSLENTLACKLFHRNRGQLSLTPSGDILNQVLRKSFSRIEDAVDKISAEPSIEHIANMSVSTAFVSHWLLPQMDDLKTAFPTLKLGFQLAGGEMTGPIEPSDIGLRHESELPSTHNAVEFAPEWIIAVASPDYLEQNGSLDDPKGPGGHMLLNLENPRITWDLFLRQTANDSFRQHSELLVPDYSVVLQTALNGGGVALGFVSSCSHLLGRGLLKPASRVCWKTGKSYYLVRSAQSQSTAPLNQIVAWFCAQSQNKIEKVAALMRVLT